MRAETGKFLGERLSDPAVDTEHRAMTAWVLGHTDQESARSLLFEVADHPSEPRELRTVAGYAWWRLGPARDAAELARAASEWPEPVLAPTLQALLDETMTDAHYEWTRTVLECRPELSRAALMLGDYPEDRVGWAFVDGDEMKTLGLPDPAGVDYHRMLARGEDWADHPPGTFFGQQAFRDAYRWAQAALRMRVARMRCCQLRQWEAWLRAVLREPAESEPPAPRFIPIRLQAPRSQAQATTLLILGAFRESGHETDPVGMSAALSAAAAGLHVSMSQVYEHAHTTSWHVAGMTGQLELLLTTGPR
ncbi:MAG: hypothetical protein ACP5QO_05915 [Clostridia bacterium]